MNILFKYATRSRPDKFQEGLRSIYENLSDRSKSFLLVTIDDDDRSMDNYRYFSDVNSGNSKNKIDAINRDMDRFYKKWDILVCMSDDMRFIKKGFDDIIREDMQNHFPDLDGVLHYNDGNQGANCMTMSIMGRRYYQRFNYIYHPEYESLWCDLEAQEVAQILGRYQYMGDDKVLFNHLHPSFGLTQYDEQYLRTEAMDVRSRDEQLYHRRKANNFYISSK